MTTSCEKCQQPVQISDNYCSNCGYSVPKFAIKVSEKTAIELLTRRVEHIEKWKKETLPQLLVETYEQGYKAGKNETG